MAFFQPPESNPWTKIQDFIDQICSFQMITPQMRMDTYTEIYNYYWSCIVRSTGDFNSSNIGKLEDKLYHHIETCLQNKLKNICQSIVDMEDEDVLGLYHKYWNQYKVMCHNLNSGCYYIVQQSRQRQGEKIIIKFDDIDVLSEQIWENFFFKPLVLYIARVCLNLIKIHRTNKSPVDTDLIKKMVQIYLDHNFNEKMKNLLNNNSTIDSISNIYKKYFEIEFLRDAEDFYRHQDIPTLELNSMATYLTPIAEKFDEITNFDQLYLPKDTLQMLRNILEEIFISDDNLNKILDKLNTFICSENHQELSNLYEPISHIPKIKNKLVETVECYIYQTGIQQLESISTIIINYPEHYVQTIYQISIKYKTFIRQSFNNDPSFVASLDTTCQRFVNKYSINKTADNTIKSSELLARYCDIILRKRSKVIQETDFEDKIKQIMVVFNYIEDKDIFIKFYQQMLSKRLIGQLSTSDDYEELIISKLKQICGVDYTSKLQQMFQDIRLSKTLVNQYKTFRENQNPIDTIDFSIMILSSNAWPFSTHSNIILPSELKATFDSFTDFYNQQHNGRRLIWLYQYSKGELQTVFTETKYNLQVSTYQMVVLLLFNKSSSLTIEQIEDKTQIKKELLLEIVYDLLKSQLLTCTEINKDFNESDIKFNYHIQIKNDFKNDKIRINLNTPFKSIKQKDPEKFNQTIDEDRNMIIQAAIIRIMKAKKTLKHALLMQEVIQQLSLRFKPKVPLIKKSIDILIEKEYLQRTSDEKDLLEYSA